MPKSARILPRPASADDGKFKFESKIKFGAEIDFSNIKEEFSLHIAGMFRPSENANDLFRRMAINGQSFEYRINNKSNEKLNFGDVVEIQSITSEIPEVCVEVCDCVDKLSIRLF